jgi:predicted metal-dependent peptidase
MEDSKAMLAMQKARGQLYQIDKFYGTLAMHLDLVEDPTCKTAWTDGVSIGFNPDFILNNPIFGTDYGRMFTFKHEVWHPLLGHHTRREGRDPETWGEAADRAIHWNFKHREGMKLLEGVLYNPGDQDQSTEMIYTKIAREKIGKKQGSQGTSSDQKPEPGGSEPAWVDFGEVRDLPGKKGGPASPSEKILSEARWVTILERAIKESKAFGQCPGYAVDILEAKKKVLINWKEVLNRFFQDCLDSDDYNWMAPNKRFSGMDIFIPSLGKGQDLGTIVFAIDTSGSMDKPALDQCVAELNKILEAFQVKVIVLLCDRQIHKVLEFEPDDLPLKIEAIGRGGTSFIPVFQWVKENMPEAPTALLYYTDGDGSFPLEEPEYPVLWIGTRNFRPRFGELVPIQGGR